PNWDPGLFVVEADDVPHLLGPDKLRSYLDVSERHIAAINAVIEEHGEKAVLEALRRRHVLIDYIPYLLGTENLRDYIAATECHIAAIDAVIEEHGEKAALEALRRRGVLIDYLE